MPRKWKTLGADEACAWGTIQGSGKDPYQACIDFSGPAFKCTCPSRKFPCKHGLGLFLIVAQQAAALTEKKPPAWTTSKQRSSVDDIYAELDWLKKYLVERDIWDSACWAHYTRLRSLCSTWIPKPTKGHA